MLSRDFVGGVATIVIGSVYLYFAYQLRVSALDDSMGPSGMPKVYGWLMVALGAMLTVQSFVAQRAMAAGRTPRPEKGEWDGQGRKIAYAAGLILIGIAYLFVVDTLGYVISIALLVSVTAAYLGAGFSARVVAIGIAGAVFLWAMFVALLGVRMPSGILAPLGF
jgi:putative tricarboxylic transport membrane protein